MSDKYPYSCVRAVKTYNNRWVLVDKESGIIVDTAQGYGYTTPRRAYACWSYKHPYETMSMKDKSNG